MGFRLEHETQPAVVARLTTGEARESAYFAYLRTVTALRLAIIGALVV